MAHYDLRIHRRECLESTDPITPEPQKSGKNAQFQRDTALVAEESAEF